MEDRTTDKATGPPRSADAKMAEAVALLERQYLLTQYLINTRAGALEALENAIAAKAEQLDHVLAVFGYVFALIDDLVRYQKIVFSLPMFSQKSPGSRAFNDAMGQLKDVRNQLQHINNDIENEQSGPLLGAVCWVKGASQFIASFHDVSRQRSVPGIVFDRQEGRYLQDFCYVYNDVYYDLGRAIAGLHKFQSFINESVKLSVDGKPYSPEKHFVAMRIEMKSLGQP